MKGVKYNCVINDKIKLTSLEMKDLVRSINLFFEEEYDGLIEVNSTKIYNIVNRPKFVSKNLKKLLKIEYVKKLT
tara:strand:- start:4329 stop:4553 length:225 start_codon:yes stop_codon:yes gene_type:complete